MLSRLVCTFGFITLAAAIVRSPPQTQFEADVHTIIDPLIDLNVKLFGMTGDNRFDEWHDSNGKPNATHAQIVEVVDTLVAHWDQAGTQFAARVTQENLNNSDATYDYVQLLDSLFPISLYTAWFLRLSSPWSVALNFSVDQAKEEAGKYDTAWLNAVLKVEEVIPSITRDYQVAIRGAWTPGALLNDWYPALAAHLEAIPWLPVVEYCSELRGKCNNRLRTYPADTCHSAADLGVQAAYFGIGNGGRGFPWECQIYTDNECMDVLFVPAQPCEFPPEWCDETFDWDGKFGRLPNVGTSDQNPSGLPWPPAGSFKCIL